MLSRFVGFIYNNPFPFMLAWIVVIVLSVIQIAQTIRLEVSMEKLLGESSSEYRSYAKYTELFGNDETFTLLVSTDGLFTADNLHKLQALSKVITQQTPYIDKLTSFINIPLIRQEKDTLVLATALEPWPDSDAALQQRINTLLTEAPQLRALISEDSRNTLLVITLKQHITDKQPQRKIGPVQYLEVLYALENIAAQQQTTAFRIRVSGQAAFLGLVQKLLVKDLFILPATALTVNIICLMLMFKRRSGVLIPGLSIVLPVTGSISLMSLLDKPIQLPTALLPPALIVISMATCVHIMAAFYNELAKSNDKYTALIQAFHHKSRALAMTTLTTVAGFLSCIFGDTDPITNVGIFGAVGTLLVLLSITVVMPVYVRLLPMRPLHKHLQHKQENSQIGGYLAGPIDKILAACATLSTSYPGPISLAAVLALITFSIMATHIHFAHNPSEWLPQHWQTVSTAHDTDRQFHSNVSIEILIDSGKINGLLAPEFMRTLMNLDSSIANIPQTVFPSGFNTSIYRIIQQSRNTLGGIRIEDDHNAAPSRLLQRDFTILRLIAPDLIESLVSADYRYTRLSIRTPMRDGADYAPIIHQLEQITKKQVKPPFTASITGQVPILTATQASVAHTAILSYLLSILTIFAMMVFHTRKLRDGFAMMVPNVLPVVIVISCMWWLGMSMDLLSMMVVSIAMGLVVDDTIHFSADFRHYLQITGDAVTSVKMALQESGRAMIITTTVLALGWKVVAISEFEKIGVFGNLIGIIMVLGLMAELIISPAILVYLYRKPPVAVQAV